MNCQNFELVITDLARDQIIDAAVRQSAMDHAEHCTACGGRLADENTLTAALRAVAVETQACKPSANVEEVLLKTFRESTINAKSMANAANGSINQRYFKYAGAAAAIIAVVLTLVAFSLHINNQRDTAKTTIVPGSPTAPPQDPPKQIEKEPLQVTIANHHSERPQRSVHRALKNTSHSGAATGNSDLSAEFIALPTAGTLAPLESGQIVRVEVMRSSLIAIGLPMNAQRAGESIKADLLVGQDGLPRAIRFVQ